MIRLGILDFDTSHASAFARCFNHQGKDREQWVEGAQVVIACPGDSQMMPERIPGYKKEIQGMNIPLVDRPEEMIGKVDGMLIESQQGSQHLPKARPFLQAGIPCFIDKPFTSSVRDAREIICLSERHHAPIFTSSSLRYVPELAAYMASNSHGPILGAMAYGPASLHEGNPGWFNYGIHSVEVLYTIMGPGCARVSCIHEQGFDHVTGHWKDGRVGTIRGARAGAQGNYGATIFADRETRSFNLNTKFIYRELAKKMVEFFTTRKAPVDPCVSLEIVAFIEAALVSGNNHGLNVNVQC